MSKFAKVFDHLDTQVLFVLTESDEGHPQVRSSTRLHGLEVSLNIEFKHTDYDMACKKAQAVFDALDEKSAIGAYNTLVEKVGDLTELKGG
jgi:hypothetical protein